MAIINYKNISGRILGDKYAKNSHDYTPLTKSDKDAEKRWLQQNISKANYEKWFKFYLEEFDKNIPEHFEMTGTNHGYLIGDWDYRTGDGYTIAIVHFDKYNKRHELYYIFKGYNHNNKSEWIKGLVGFLIGLMIKYKIPINRYWNELVFE